MDWPALSIRVFERLLAGGNLSPEFRDYVIAELARRKGAGAPYDPVSGRPIKKRYSQFDPI
jgi:hypothetical protein